MLTKAYLVLLAISAALTGFFTFYAWTWIQSIASPVSAAEGYNFNAGIAWLTLCITSLLLLLLANLILAKEDRAIPMWSTLGYFAVFTLTHYIFLERSAAAKFTDELLGRSTAIGTFVGVFLCLGAAVVIYADQFGLVRLRRNIYDEKNATITTDDENLPASADE